MAGSITTTTRSVAGHYTEYTIEWVSDALGDVNSNTVELPSGRIVQIESRPGTGATQPTDSYKLKMKTASGLDLIGDKAMDNVEPELFSFAQPVVFRKGTLELIISAAGNAKTGTVVIMWEPRG